MKPLPLVFQSPDIKIIVTTTITTTTTTQKVFEVPNVFSIVVLITGAL